MGKKKLRTQGGSSSNAENGVEIQDERFAKALNAPIFNKIGGKDGGKVQIDDRFKSILTDERFRVNPGASVDAYGRKKKSQKQGDLALKELNRLYKIDDATASDETKGGDAEEEEEEEDEEEEDEEEENVKTKKGKKKGEPSESMEDRLDYLNKLARGEVSGSDSDDSSDDNDGFENEGSDSGEGESEEEYDSDVVDKLTKSALAIPGDEDSDVAEYGEATRRISILNCDWENIKAEDLM